MVTSAQTPDSTRANPLSEDNAEISTARNYTLAQLSLYALKLDAVERILAPGDPVPSGRRLIDLARRLELSPSPDSHLALLSGGELVVSVGNPVGAARIDAAWILPLPGYMFRVSHPPFRGLIDVPPGRGAKMPAEALARASLLLDEVALREMPS